MFKIKLNKYRLFCRLKINYVKCVGIFISNIYIVIIVVCILMSYSVEIFEHFAVSISRGQHENQITRMKNFITRPALHGFYEILFRSEGHSDIKDDQFDCIFHSKSGKRGVNVIGIEWTNCFKLVFFEFSKKRWTVFCSS